MLTSHDVGRRVSVRRRVEGGLTDVLGHLLDLTDDQLEVLARGEVLTLATADVTAAKVVPPATPRRGLAGPDGHPGRHAADLLGRLAGPRARAARRLGAAGARRHHRTGQLGDGGRRPRAAGG